MALHLQVLNLVVSESYDQCFESVVAASVIQKLVGIDAEFPCHIWEIGLHVCVVPNSLYLCSTSLDGAIVNLYSPLTSPSRIKALN